MKWRFKRVGSVCTVLSCGRKLCLFSPVKMLASPLSSAELGSCPSETFILLQGFPTRASTENAWARELRPCILTNQSVFPLFFDPSKLRFCAAQMQQQQQLNEPFFSHGGSVTLRNWSDVFPCVPPDARLHPKILDYWHASCPRYNICLSPFIRSNVSPLPSASRRRLVPLVPRCASRGGREERGSHSSTWPALQKIPSPQSGPKIPVSEKQDHVSLIEVKIFLPTAVAFSSLNNPWNKRAPQCIKCQTKKQLIRDNRKQQNATYSNKCSFREDIKHDSANNLYFL